MTGETRGLLSGSLAILEVGLNTPTDALNTLERISDNGPSFLGRAKQTPLHVPGTLSWTAGIGAEGIFLKYAPQGSAVDLPVHVLIALLLCVSRWTQEGKTQYPPDKR